MDKKYELTNKNRQWDKTMTGKASRTPWTLSGLLYPVTCTDTHIKIGCEVHDIAAWAAFAAIDIEKMDGRRGLAFWERYKTLILTIANAHQAGECPFKWAVQLERFANAHRTANGEIAGEHIADADIARYEAKKND